MLQDPLHGIRVHCWVLVLEGNRDIKEGSFYIEPATGTRYPVNQSPYLAIESLWNCHNYWVNMQDCSNGVDNISFDLMNTHNWEYIFLDHQRCTQAPENMDPSSGMLSGTNDMAEAEPFYSSI